MTERKFVRVEKSFPVREGETVAGACSALYYAFSKKKRSSDEHGWSWMHSIFADHLIAQHDDEKYMRYDFTRGKDGEFTLSDPVQVAMKFEPVTKMEKSGGGLERVEINFWGGVL